MGKVKGLISMQKQNPEYVTLVKQLFDPLCIQSEPESPLTLQIYDP
jgi:hypothetical protein